MLNMISSNVSYVGIKSRHFFYSHIESSETIKIYLIIYNPRIFNTQLSKATRLSGIGITFVIKYVCMCYVLQHWNKTADPKNAPLLCLRKKEMQSTGINYLRCEHKNLQKT